MTTTDTRPLRMPSTARLGLARTGIEVKEFFRQRDSVIFTFTFPVILLFIFGSVFSDDIAPGVSFTQYFTAGMVPPASSCPASSRWRSASPSSGTTEP